MPLKSFSREAGSMRLRPMTQGDEPLFHALYTDPEIMRFVGGPWTPAEAAERFRATLCRRGKAVVADRFFVIEEKSSREPMGICGSSHYDRAGMRVEVGVMLLPRGRRLGVGRAALGALVDYMFQEPSLLEVYARVAIENSAARNLVTRVGFRQSRVAEGKKQGTLACEWSVHRPQWNTRQTTNNGIADVQCN
jgi:RimJ/RimL family protein N-acetyltransferase